VPRALHREGRLGSLHTDYWAGPVVRKLAGKASLAGLHSLAARYHAELEYTEIRSWNWQSLGWQTKNRYRGSEHRQEPYSGFIDIGRRFALRVRDALRQRTDLGSPSIFFAYDTGALEAMEWSRNRRIRCVLNQVDPSRVEIALVREEEKQWPGWQPKSVDVPEEYFFRREQEWALADRVVVNSAFCREALLRQGVPAEKVAIVPLCYERDCREQQGGYRTFARALVRAS
jgi:hypothetical protein